MTPYKVVESSCKEELEKMILKGNPGENIGHYKGLHNRDIQLIRSSFIIFGAGSLGRKVLTGLIQIGIEPMAFVDNNKVLWETDIEGIPVLSPLNAAVSYGKSSIFIISVWNPNNSFIEIKNQLEEIGCTNVISFISLFRKYPDIFLPYYCLDLPHKLYDYKEEILKTYDLWSDDASRYEYLNQIRFRISGNFEDLSLPIKEEQYFPENLFRSNSNEVFVDCGAFDGDTISMFLQKQNNNFSKIFAFEPDPINFHKLINYVEGLDDKTRANIKCFNCAVGADSEIVHFKSEGTESSSIGEGNSFIECISLDRVLKNQMPTFIKMDIEGYEIEALIGAQEMIRKNTPILVISVYHKQNHIWQIPLLIKSFNEEYSIFLRNHRNDGWDLVCYAIPTNRVCEGVV